MDTAINLLALTILVVLEGACHAGMTPCSRCGGGGFTGHGTGHGDVCGWCGGQLYEADEYAVAYGYAGAAQRHFELELGLVKAHPLFDRDWLVGYPDREDLWS